MCISTKVLLKTSFLYRMSKQTANYKSYILGIKNWRYYSLTVFNDSSRVTVTVSNAISGIMFDIAIDGARSDIFLAKCNMALETDQVWQLSSECATPRDEQHTVHS